MRCRPLLHIAVACVWVLSACAGSDDPVDARADPLPSWTASVPRSAILNFVARVSDPAHADFVPAPERIAVFDNDGTLIVERPTIVQFEFLYQRIKALAPEHPEWATIQPFKAVLEDDREGLAAMGFRKRGDLVTYGQANITQETFYAAAEAFLATGRHVRFDRPYTELVYRPMLELIRFLQASDFRVFIVSGGGIEFIRSFSEGIYGINRENVIGSSMKYGLREIDGRLSIYRQPGWQSLNAGRFKPINIQLHIGRRPILAVGNSDGDLDMLRFVADGKRPSLILLVHHDDAEREYAYADEAAAARELAAQRGWQHISMADDFRAVFAARQ